MAQVMNHKFQLAVMYECIKLTDCFVLLKMPMIIVLCLFEYLNLLLGFRQEWLKSIKRVLLLYCKTTQVHLDVIDCVIATELISLVLRHFCIIAVFTLELLNPGVPSFTTLQIQISWLLKNLDLHCLSLSM